MQLVAPATVVRQRGGAYLQSSLSGQRTRPESAAARLSERGEPRNKGVMQMCMGGFARLIHLHACLVPVVAEPDDDDPILFLHIVQRHPLPV
jgi:hypothetical protein